MRADFYQAQTAEAPRLLTDTMFVDRENTYQYEGMMKEAFSFVEEAQLLRTELWERFVMQFRMDADADSGWRGEYWGKMMRGACFVYMATRNEALYDCLKKSVEAMCACADENGRISSYGIHHEFTAWDLWCRKYVLLGMQYFLEICKEEAQKEKIIASMKAQADYILQHIGKEDAKTSICAASSNWRGLNSASLLEPMVRLYTITKEERYLDFATYIVALGGTSVANIFELAYADELYPYQYPITKAYEMMSCFEGLLEYYRVTRIEKYKMAVIRFADKVLESDVTVIGSCGCTHELFDHSTVRQANTTNERIQQETCVTVTWMKFMYQLLLLTGDAKYAEAFETSLYNAYMGAFNTAGVIEPSLMQRHKDAVFEPLPFDSYSPLTAGLRGNGVGGLCIMSDRHYYGCCAAIGAAGMGLVPKMHVHTTDKGFAIQLFIKSTVTSQTPGGQKIMFATQTDYPRDGVVDIRIAQEQKEAYEIKIRNPKWSKTTKVFVNKEAAELADGYIVINRVWENNDVIHIEFDMRTQAIYPIPYGCDVLMNHVVWTENYIVPNFDREDPLAKHHVALRRGPLMLAQDARLGYDVNEPMSVDVDADGYVEATPVVTDIYPNNIAMHVPKTDGTTFLVTDYASAGKLWTEESQMAVWMRTK